MEFIWDATDSQPYNLSVFIHRYASRCLMVEFTEPPLQMTIAEYMGLVELWTACSSCAGLCISLGKKFFHQGVEEVDQMILPEFLSDVAGSISPRVCGIRYIQTLINSTRIQYKHRLYVLTLDAKYSTRNDIIHNDMYRVLNTVMLHLPFGICSKPFWRDDWSSCPGTGHDRSTIGGVACCLVRGGGCLDRGWDNIEVAPVSAKSAVSRGHCV